MRRQLSPAVMMILAMTLLCGLVYTFAVTALAQILSPGNADGSRVTVRGRDVGSKLIGQSFVDADGQPLRQYFQPRPSAATGPDGTTSAGYDPRLSQGSNLGPSNPCFVPDPSRPCRDDDGRRLPPIAVARARAYRAFNGLPGDRPVPVDAVTASASGLDPDISVANARLQAPRVAAARALSLRRVRHLIARSTSARTFGILGEHRVNVLVLNLALDRVAPVSP